LTKYFSLSCIFVWSVMWVVFSSRHSLLTLLSSTSVPPPPFFPRSFACIEETWDGPRDQVCVNCPLSLFDFSHKSLLTPNNPSTALPERHGSQCEDEGHWGVKGYETACCCWKTHTHTLARHGPQPSKHTRDTDSTTHTLRTEGLIGLCLKL